MSNENLSTLLAQVSTVASVRASTLGMSRLDKDASKQAERAHNAQSGIAKVNVSRLAGAEDRIKAIKQLQTRGREALIDTTTAWGERRLLPNTLLETFMGQWGPIKKSFDEEVNRLKYDAPQLITDAERNKGNFNVDIPTVEEINEAFSLEFNLEPVPDVSKFSSNIGDKQLEAQLKQVFEANIAAAYNDAQSDAVMRLAKPLQNIVERMQAYDQREVDAAKGLDVGKAGYFRDSVIGNVQQVAEVFGSWNLTDDPFLKSLDDALSAFGGIEAEDLRKHADLRADTAKRAAEILEKIRAGGYLT